MDISKNIRTIREDRRLTQLEIAEKLHMERSNYARLEARGNKLSVEQLEQIAAALEVTVFQLMNGDVHVAGYTNEVSKLKQEVEDLKKWLNDKELLIVYLKRELENANHSLNQK